MKRQLMWCMAALCIGAGGASAQSVGPVNGGSYVNDNPYGSSDDKWACEIVLCMANPSGPMAAAECVAPIKKMYRALAKGKAIPRCKQSSGSTQGGGSGLPGAAQVQQSR